MARVAMWRSIVMSKAKTLYWCSPFVTNGKRAIRCRASAIGSTAVGEQLHCCSDVRLPQRNLACKLGPELDCFQLAINYITYGFYCTFLVRLRDSNTHDNQLFRKRL